MDRKVGGRWDGSVTSSCSVQLCKVRWVEARWEGNGGADRVEGAGGADRNRVQGDARRTETGRNTTARAGQGAQEHERTC